MPRTKKSRSSLQQQELEDLSTSIQEASEQQEATTPSMEHLLEALAIVSNANQRNPTPKPFKAPTFSGNEDVDLFISQFEEVHKANKWTEEQAKLHLKLSLSGKAANCTEGADKEEIYDNLQARFGLSARKAKEILRSIKKKENQDLHELGIEISKLTRIAYPKLSKPDQEEMALEIFSRAMDSVGLQQHFLATRPTTLRQAIQMTDEFCQVSGNLRKAKLNTVTELDNTQKRLGELSTQQEALHTLLLQQQKQHQQVLEQLQQIQRQPLQSYQPPFQQSTPPLLQYQLPIPQNRPPPSCYECQGPHFRRNCPRLKQYSPPPQNRPPLRCYECQGPHLKKNCPQLQQKERQVSENYQGPAQ